MHQPNTARSAAAAALAFAATLLACDATTQDNIPAQD
jgi:hypothetical protein